MRLRELAGELESELAAHEVRVLLEESLSLGPGEVALGGARELTDDELGAIRRAAARVRNGEPLQYVVGHWGFRGLDLILDARALIPRPETELIVDLALDLLKEVRGGEPGGLVLDLGTGTGAIGLALCSECESLQVICSDRSHEAITLCAENVARLPASARDRISLVEGDLYDALPPQIAGRLHVVVSNPPYLSHEEWREAPGVVRDHEPRGALDAGPTGTEVLEVVIGGAPRVLVPGGGLVAEIGWLQGPAALALASAAGGTGARLHQDLLGRDRFVVARF